MSRLGRRPSTLIELGGGRTLAADDVGDPAGYPVVYLHGSPDSRLARHPDDGIAADLGIRLVAVDRPGFGHSTADLGGTYAAFAQDVRVLADALDLDRFALLGWSAGAMPALAVAAVLPDRVTRVGIAAGLTPLAAYAEPRVLEAADGGRRMLVEMGAEMGSAAAANEAAAYLVPHPPTPDLVREHLLEGSDPVRLRELESVPGAVDVMVAAMADAVRNGLAGVTHDLELQLREPDFDLASIEAEVTLWYGTADPTAPPAFGRWYDEQLVNAELRLIEGAGHTLLLTHWAELLRFSVPQ